jgi:hypothetical protein
VLILGSLLLLSCASVPSSRDAARWIAVLPPPTKNSVYLSVDAASSPELLQILAEIAVSELAGVRTVAARLDRIHAWIGLSPGEPPDFSLIALGTLTPTSVAFKLNHDPAWQRVSLDPWPGEGFSSSHWSYRTYWRKNDLQIAAPQRAVLFVAGGTGGDPAAAEGLLRRLQSPGANPLPSQAAAELERADIFLYFPDPAGLAASSLPRSASTQDPAALLQNVPLRRAWLSAVSGPEGYELQIVFLLSGAQNPRPVEAALRLMLILWVRKAEIEDPVAKLKAVAISAGQGVARIEALTFSTRELVSLFQALLPKPFDPGGQ